MYRQAEQLKDETSQAQLLVDSYEVSTAHWSVQIN